VNEFFRPGLAVCVKKSDSGGNVQNRPTATLLSVQNDFEPGALNRSTPPPIVYPFT